MAEKQILTEEDLEEKCEEKQEKQKPRSLMNKFVLIRSELKVPKGQHNDFGNYSFRSCEDILEKIKPLEAKYNVAVVLSDRIQYIPLTMSSDVNVIKEEVWDENAKRVLTKDKIEKGRYYIEATATLYDCDSDSTISNKAYAREEDCKKGMDASQITGTASSYARKYALSGLFGLDDIKDADTNEFNKITATSQTTSITLEEAKGYVFKEGTKHAGKTLETVFRTDPKYIEYLVQNKMTNPALKACIEVIEKSGGIKNRAELLKEMKELELKTNSVHEKILEKFGVNSDTKMTIKQIEEAIETMKKYVPEEPIENKNYDEVTPYDFK